MRKELIYAYLLVTMVAIVALSSTSFAESKTVCSTVLSKDGGCSITCSEVSYSCKANGKTSSGLKISAQAVGFDRYQTADEAILLCQNLGGKNCRASTFRDCGKQTNVISQNSCRRSATLDLNNVKIGENSYLFASVVSP
jgi:hypothetical protein